MTFVIAIIITMIVIAVGWSITSNDKERLDRKLEIGKDIIDDTTYRLLETSEYTARCYSGRLDVLKNETHVALIPLCENLTNEEYKYIRCGLGQHLARRAKLTISKVN